MKNRNVNKTNENCSSARYLKNRKQKIVLGI